MRGNLLRLLESLRQHDDTPEPIAANAKAFMARMPKVKATELLLHGAFERARAELRIATPPPPQKAGKQ